MSLKIGIPILKGMTTGRYKRGDAHINADAAAAEALPSEKDGKRRCSDPDYRPEDTAKNLAFFNGPRTFEQARKVREDRVREFNATAKRKINKNSPVSCVGILKPDKELMAGMTEKEQELLLDRAFHILLELLDKTPENVIYCVIHKDEGNPHIHFELDGRTKDGRWSTTPMFQLKTKTALNETLPRLLNDRYGYHIETCSRSDDAPKTKSKPRNLDPIAYKKNQELKKENAELSVQIDGIRQHKNFLQNRNVELESKKQELEKAISSHEQDLVSNIKRNLILLREAAPKRLYEVISWMFSEFLHRLDYTPERVSKIISPKKFEPIDHDRDR